MDTVTLERERLEMARGGGKEAELDGEIMEQRILEAAMKGDTSVFVDGNWCHNYLIHLAVEHGQLNFVKEALMRFPALLSVKNSNDDTPLHIASRIHNHPEILSFLISHFRNNNVDDDGWLLTTNTEGNTPFHAALTSRNVEAAATFLRHCTQQQLQTLFAISNRHGHNVLHLLARYCPANDLFDEVDDIKALYRDIFMCSDDLRTKQDEDGNTPLHLAIKNRKFKAVKLLLQRCLDSEPRQELSIKNNEGDSVFDLLASQVHMTDMPPHIMQLKEMMMRGQRLVKERAHLKRKMDDRLYKAAIEMDCNVFTEVRRRDGDDLERAWILGHDQDAYFLAQTPNGSNIVHITLQQGKEEGAKFVEEALNRFPSLVLQTDSNGDTPLHLAAKRYTPVSEAFLLGFVDAYQNTSRQHQRGVIAQPWKAKNSKGNMPIHEAVRFNNAYATLALMEIDHFGASYLNDSGETPLHLYARFGFFPVEEDGYQVFDTLITKDQHAAYTRDGDGLTPLLRAAKCGRFRTMLGILKHCPQSAYIQDLHGRTFLHLLHLTGGDVDEHSADQLFKQMGENLFKIPEADAQRLVLDYEGNTPLHYAIKTENSITAEILTRRCLQTKDQPELMWVNNKDHTVLKLLASHEVATEVVDLIRSTHRNVMYSARSSYGVRKKDIKDSAGSLSVIAGLLATITFAAAFQVPGGFNSESGSPVLLKMLAFQIFLMSDPFAMCSSMVVLFSLLWVMGSGKTFDSFVLLDISFILLQSSFYATVVAFMTGVYVATASKTLWLATFICVLCSAILLISWRSSILFISKNIRLLIDMILTVKGCSFRTYTQHHKSLSTQ